MKFSKTLLLLCLPLATWAQSSQQGSGKSFTLAEAIKYAKDHNPNLANAKLDVDAARYKVKEITASGLPQVNASGNFTHNVQIATQVIPNAFGGGGGDYIELKFGTPYTMTGSVSASQLLFDGTFFLGLKASKEFVTLSQQTQASTAIETEVNVTKAYYLVLITEENLRLVESNIETVKKTVTDTRAYYDQGFAEKLDVDRLDLLLSNLEINRATLIDQSSIIKKMLKLQMGMNIDEEITLTDNLQSLNEQDIPSLADAESKDVSGRVEYQLLTQQSRLNVLDMRRYKVGYAPTLSAFFTHQQNTFRTRFNFFSSNTNPTEAWFPATMWGLRLDVPVFDGFRKHNQLQQARISYEKTQNQLTNFESAARVERLNAKTRYTTALEQIKTRQQNLDLADEIYRMAEVKYREGVGSSLEVTNAGQDVKTAQSNYLNAIYDLLIAKTDLKKAIGKF